jgi:HAD superfamily hydrolase (TIGR01490 family)
VVAAFDFDGTLTRHDSLLPFLRRLCGDAAVLRVVVRRLPVIVAAAAGWVSRHRAKEAVLGPLLRGRRLEEVTAVAEDYARRLLGRLDRRALRWLEWHRRRGDEVVIVSASPELYLVPVGQALGCRAVLATRLEVAPDGRLTGRIAGRNVRGSEKVARLERWLEGTGAELWAYGDSRGDRELLARARRPFRRCRGGFRALEVRAADLTPGSGP